MAKQTIGIGATPGDGTGDSLRDSFDKANDNFTELYDGAASDAGALATHVADVANPHAVTKAQVGLGNVTDDAQLKAADLDTDSTMAANSDAKIPSQKAAKTALDLKAPLASPALTGTPTAPTATPGTNNTQIATTAYADAAAAAAAAAVLDSAPGALDTLNELAAAINDDASFASTVTTALSGKAPTTRSIGVSGLATGGGDLSADRTIGVPAASQAEAEAGTDNTKVMTPLRTAEALAALSHILQMVVATKTDSASSSSPTWEDSGFSASITPRSTASKILVIFSGAVGGQANYLSAYKMTRAGTDILIGDAVDSRTRAQFGGYGFNNGQTVNATIICSDSPETTSATTYRLEWITEAGSLATLNRSFSDTNAYYGVRGASSIILIEYQ